MSSHFTALITTLSKRDFTFIWSLLPFLKRLVKSRMKGFRYGCVCSGQLEECVPNDTRRAMTISIVCMKRNGNCNQSSHCVKSQASIPCVYWEVFNYFHWSCVLLKTTTNQTLIQLWQGLVDELQPSKPFYSLPSSHPMHVHIHLHHLLPHPVASHGRPIIASVSSSYL